VPETEAALASTNRFIFVSRHTWRILFLDPVKPTTT
jgi:hypothetical protein